MKIFTEKVLVVDPANTSGYCIIDIVKRIKEFNLEPDRDDIILKTPIAIIHSSEYISFPEKKSDTKGQGRYPSGPGRYPSLVYDFFKKVIEEQKIQKVYAEEYFFSKRFANGSTVNVSIRTAIAMACYDLSIEYIPIKISEWKKSVAGRMFASKEEKKEYGKDANKIFIMRALEEERPKGYGIVFPEKIKSKNSKREIKFKYDMSDCIGQAIHTCLKHYSIKKENIIFYNLF